jgi:hypothetical protein
MREIISKIVIDATAYKAVYWIDTRLKYYS